MNSYHYTMDILIGLSNLKMIHGVGDSLAERLIDGGYYDSESVADAEPHDVSMRCIRISYGTAKRFIRETNKLLAVDKVAGREE